MPNAHVPAAATGLPTFCADLATIDDCSLVYAGIQSMLDAVTGIMSRPKCEGGTLAFARLDQIGDWLMAEADRVIHAAGAISPLTRAEADERALLLIQHEINCGSNTASIATTAASLAADRSRLPDAQH